MHTADDREPPSGRAGHESPHGRRRSEYRGIGPARPFDLPPALRRRPVRPITVRYASTSSTVQPAERRVFGELRHRFVGAAKSTRRPARPGHRDRICERLQRTASRRPDRRPGARSQEPPPSPARPPRSSHPPTFSRHRPRREAVRHAFAEVNATQSYSPIDSDNAARALPRRLGVG